MSDAFDDIDDAALDALIAQSAPGASEATPTYVAATADDDDIDDAALDAVVAAACAPL